MTSEGDFSVLIFNVSHSHAVGSTEGITEDQKKGIEFILKETEGSPNLLILAQDRIRGKKINAFESSLELGGRDKQKSSTASAHMLGGGDHKILQVLASTPELEDEDCKMSSIASSLKLGDGDYKMSSIASSLKLGDGDYKISSTASALKLEVEDCKMSSTASTRKLGGGDYDISSTDTAGIFLDNRSESRKCAGEFLPDTDYPTKEGLVGRLSAFVLELGGTDKRRVLVVSYHGVNIKKGEVKNYCLKELIQWAKGLWKRKKYFAFVIGGDFNRKMSKAKDLLESQADLQFEPQDDTFQKSLDFVITFPKGTLQVVSDPKVLKLADWDTPEKIKGYKTVQKVSERFRRKCHTHPTFDHPRVLFSFRVVSTEADMGGITEGMKKMKAK